MPATCSEEEPDGAMHLDVICNAPQRALCLEEAVVRSGVPSTWGSESSRSGRTSQVGALLEEWMRLAPTNGQRNIRKPSKDVHRHFNSMPHGDQTIRIVPQPNLRIR